MRINHFNEKFLSGNVEWNIFLTILKLEQAEWKDERVKKNNFNLNTTISRAA